ncbi:MAG TPA: hypothetical protein VFV40_05260 [Nocardioides sp.]|nr:hypothetical protein [Nocardioides sp.]
MSKRTWDSIHRRGEVLRAVVDEANARRDGVLPTDLPGVAETFGDELSLVAALQLRWHTRLAGRIERALMDQPMDLETAVATAWRATAEELAGVRMILDSATAHPSSEEMAEALETAARKDWTMLAAMAGKAGPGDPGAPAVGRSVEERARALYRPDRTEPRHRAEPLPSRGDVLRDQLRGRLTKLKAHLAA